MGEERRGSALCLVHGDKPIETQIQTNKHTFPILSRPLDLLPAHTHAHTHATDLIGEL